MTEIKIRFDLTFNRRFISRALAAAILFGAVPELESESVTLSTYYPAPSGVYTQMITTGNTYLARDGGAVYERKIIGTGGSAGDGVQFSIADPKAADIVIGSDAGTRHDSSIMMWSAASASRIFQQADVFYLSTWNRTPVAQSNIALAAAPGGTSTFGGPVNITGDLAITGNETVSGNLTVGGTFSAPHLKASGANGVLSAQQGCGPILQYTYASSFGGTQALCAGQYVTNVEGVYVHRYNMPPSDSANGSYMCCPCPIGGCYL